MIQIKGDLERKEQSSFYYKIILKQLKISDKTLGQVLYQMTYYWFRHNNQEMENLLAKLENLPNYKEILKIWCKSNGIKVSFLITMTLSRAKTINKKLMLTYEKGFGKAKTRWLENQLKLFHFCLLAVSCLEQTKISDFKQEHWETLTVIFPSKLQTVLQYEGANFVATKNHLKRKWDEEEDKILSRIVEQNILDPKWNEIVIDLFKISEGKFFRTSKQCRQRWLNHLDHGIKHDKWTDEEDEILIKSVLEHGKKWSYIMKCFNNQRTQHMIKNRYLSLTLKCKKNHHYSCDEEEAIRLIAEGMGLKSLETLPFHEDCGIEKRLRPKERHQTGSEEVEESPRIVHLSVNADEELQNENEGSQAIAHDLVKEDRFGSENNVGAFTKLSPTVENLPTPSSFMSPISPFAPCNNFLANLNYFQWCMSNFANQLTFSNNGNQ